MSIKNFNPKKDPYPSAQPNLQEKNMNEVLHLLSPHTRHGCSPTNYEAMNWQLGLRGDRAESIQIKTVKIKQKRIPTK
jgi:hypothetical protein